LGIEAEYAYNTHKRIVALRLEAGYTPDGCLGPLCLNNIYYDFTTPQTFDEEWTKLKAELSKEIAGNTDSSGAGLPDVFNNIVILSQSK